MQPAAVILCWVLYAVPATVLVLFGINQYVMLGIYLAGRKSSLRKAREIQRSFSERGTDTSWPEVITQLPVYNEYNVVERSMRAAAAMDYPQAKHLLQVLDDSDDQTRELIDSVARDLKTKGHRIKVIRRETRDGFKAGALKHGMSQNQAPFYVIFDADFVPPANYLRQALPIMIQRNDIGLVQARWGHLNPETSLVTRAQELGIDGHFGIEQGARAWNCLFMNFNGTAGIWRHQAIQDAGGWQADTLTEDMDLSYRAQLHGWKPFYLINLVVPAEIPQNINAFKSQQFRWAKGSIQTAKKLIPRVLEAECSLFTKIQAIFHMTHYLIHPIMVWLAFFAMPLLLINHIQMSRFLMVCLLGLILVSALGPFTLYIAAQITLHPREYRRLAMIPVLSILGVGIALSNTRAVLQAVRGKTGPFVRTPKQGDQNTIPYRIRMPWMAVGELIMGAYCWASLLVFLERGTWIIGPFLLLYATGFSLVGFLSLMQSFSSPRDTVSGETSTPVPSTTGTI